MRDYYLAVDIGASSGRHILGFIEDKKLILEEVYRFKNSIQKRDGHLCWDVDRLFSEIKKGLKICKELGKVPMTMGIDTFAVDYVLLDENDNVIGNTYAYRDKRRDGMDDQVYKLISKEDLYKRTGIQKQIFNTIYQLMAVKVKEPENIEKAETFLMLPDYFNFLITGNKMVEYTNATSSQLVSTITKDWDYKLIEILGFKKSLFKPLKTPGTTVGFFTREIQEEVGFNCEVILPTTHDTAAAVMAVPSLDEECLYISSGTWSLMGIENNKAICTAESMKKNFTNEGGYEYRFRYLKNIMGLWMIQFVKEELKNEYSFEELCYMAEKERYFNSRVDVNHQCFLSPKSMIEEIKNHCKDTNQKIPNTPGEIAETIYQSLAESYSETLREIESLTEKKFKSINIVGGGSNVDYLNKLTAKKTNKIVYAGPSEATAIGNLIAQLIKKGELKDLKEARRCIYNSFEIKKYI